MSTQVFPLAVWQSGTNENSIPANDNALRVQALMDAAIGIANIAPGSPVEDDQYVVGTAWGGFATDDVVIYKGGTWLGYLPFEGWTKVIAGDQYYFDGSDWAPGASGGGGSRIPNIQAVTSSATVTPTFLNDMVKITAQAAALTLANPSGTAIDGIGIVIRVKDNGTARAISYGTQYRAIGVTLPTTTVVSKTLYLAGIWNVEDTTFDILAVGQEA